MDTTFWNELDGKDETFGYDETKTWDDALDASFFISSWMNFEGIYSGLTDAQTTSFKVNGKIFFLTGTEFLYYDGTTVGTVQSIAYIPTTVLGRAPAGTGGTPNEKFNHLSQKWKESFSGNNATAVYQLTKQAGVTLSTNVFTAWVDGVQKAETTDFTVNRTDWTVTFSVAPSTGTDNVVIQAEATNLMDATVITKCTMAIEYGGKNDSRVMISGHTSYPNTVRYCMVYDPTYWAEDDDFNVGSDSRSILGWGRMNEYLITYKQPGDETSQWYSEIDIDTVGNVSFPTYGLNDEFGCIAQRTVHPAQNGLIALSDEGVIWTWPSLVKGQANCKVISRNVNGRNGIDEGILDNTQSDLNNAHAELYRNKYMLHIGSKTWVLDLDYSDLANNVYCWYPYTGLYSSAGAFLKRSERLYMSHSVNGLLYKSQLAGDDVEHADDGLAIDAWWTSPLMFLGGREWIKKFERIALTFKPTHGTQHILSLISDMGVEDIPLRQASGFFDARYFNAEYFNAGTLNADYPSTQSEKIGYKGEYFQFKIRNNMLNRGLTMLACVISFSMRKMVK